MAQIEVSDSDRSLLEQLLETHLAAREASGITAGEANIGIRELINKMRFVTPPTPPRDSDLLRALTQAQLEHVHKMTTSEGEYSGIQNALHSNDTYDYLRGALNLASMLLTMQYDDDLVGFERAMDPASADFIFESIACDGIAQAIYDAFPADWDEERDQRMVNESRP